MSDPIRRPVTYGDGAIQRLPQLVADLDGRRVLLVTGRQSFEASGAQRVLPDLEAAAEVRRFSDFSPNTDVDDLTVGLGEVARFDPDLIVAIGGGSALDLAKLLCAFRGTTDPASLRSAIRGGQRPERRDTGLILVPTTSGSGAEATHFAVVYIADEKFSVGSTSLLPDRVVLDPQLTVSGSAYQRATSGIDAVAQAMESLWASGATDRSRRFARHALRLLLPHLERFVEHPGDTSARAMALGSHLAGRAIDISRTTAAHALSYAITQGYGVSHGHAVALTLGPFIEAHATAAAGDLQPGVDPTTHARVMERIIAVLGATTGAEARNRFVDLIERLGLASRLSEVGVVTADQRAALVEGVNVERLGNNPVAFDTAELLKLVERAA